MFGIDLYDSLRQPWEQARGQLIEELSQLKAELRGRWNAALGPTNQLNVLSISGDGTQATRYVSNTGTANAPTWDRVNLGNGVKGRLPLSNVVTAAASTLLGRGSAAGTGDLQPITLGAGLSMTGTVLSSSAAGSWIPLVTGEEPSDYGIALNLVTDGDGGLILVWTD